MKNTTTPLRSFLVFLPSLLGLLFSTVIALKWSVKWVQNVLTIQASKTSKTRLCGNF